MIAKHLVNWIEKKENEGIAEDKPGKIALAGFTEGAIDGAIVCGLALAALGWATIAHDGLHKLSDK